MKTIADTPKMWDVKYFNGATTFNATEVGITKDDIIRYYKKTFPSRSILRIEEIRLK